MSIDSGVRNTTMLLLLMCIPLLVASCQHTFGLGDESTASSVVAEQGSAAVAASDADSAGLLGAEESTYDEAELLVSSPLETASDKNTEESNGPIDPETAAAETVSPPPAPPAPIVQHNTETVSRDDAAIDGQETNDQATAEVATKSGTAAADTNQESAGEETTVPAAEDAEEEIACYDATAEFEKWSAELDDNIRESVLREIMGRLEKATANLDRQQARLERLHVETELYRMQIQHLQNRRLEWEAAE